MNKNRNPIFNEPRQLVHDTLSRIVSKLVSVLQLSRFHTTITILVLACFINSNSSAQIINTVAGNGALAFAGDGFAATAASICQPWNVATDPTGNFFVSGNWLSSTLYSSRVRKVDAYGVINTYAGTGTSGFSGDGGYALSAQLNNPAGVAADYLGNLFIFDVGNNRIRKVTPSGIITTFAGNGLPGSSGDGGPATAAKIGVNWGAIATDAVGNVYFFNWGASKVRKVDTAGMITTVASTTSPEVFGLAVDPVGNVYIPEYWNSRVRKVSTSGIITTVAGNGAPGNSGDGGPATLAQIGKPSAVAIDLAGNLTISDYFNHRIRKVAPSGIISTIAGTGTPGYAGDGGAATAASFAGVFGLKNDVNGNLLIADYNNLRIRKITNNNRPVSFVAGLSQILVVCQDSPADSINSLLAVTDSDSYQAETWSLIGTVPHGTVNGPYTGISTGGTFGPHNLTYKPNPGYTGLDTFSIRVSDGLILDTITIFVTVNPTPAPITGTTTVVVGGYTTLHCATAGGGWISITPSLATVGSASGVVVGVSAGTSIIKYAIPSGCTVSATVNVFPFAGISITTIAGNGTSGYSGDGAAATAAKLNQPWGVAVDSAGNVYIVDYANSRIRKVNTAGVISTVAGNGAAGFGGDGGQATAASLNSPFDVAVDPAGSLVIADSYNNRIRRVSSFGIITTIAGNGSGGSSGDGGPATSASFSGPSCVEFDATGNLYITANGTNVRKIDAAGIISAFAGNGLSGYSGDGGPATAARLNNPVAVSADLAGNIFIADQLNNYIRKVNSAGIITSVAGTGSGGYSGDGAAAITAAINNPWGIAADYFGNIFIGDNNNNRLRKISVAGIMSTSAGNGSAGYSGDPCAATSAQINHPTGIAIDGSGSVYIADMSNNRVRRVSYNRAPSFVNGHSVARAVCQSAADTLNTLLSILDVDNSQTLSWSVTSGPYNGTAAVTATALSNGGLVTPSGVFYAPAFGYLGTDSFTVRVSDCLGGFDTMLIRFLVTPPPAPIVGASSVCPALTTLFVDPSSSGTWVSSNTAIATVGLSSGIVTGVATGVAVITFSPGAGCYVTKAITVNVAPAPIAGPSFVCLGQNITLTDASTGGIWTSGSPTATIGSGTGMLTGVTLGTAPITYAQGGCIALKTISINPLPGTIFGGTNVCVGDPIAFSCPGGGVWSIGTPLIATVDSFTGVGVGVSGGTPLVTYTLPGGCSATYLFTVDPAPAPISAPPSVCVAAPTTLTDPTPGGIWSTPSFSTSGTIIPGSGVFTGTSAGVATVSYTSLIGCSISTLITVNPSPGPISGGDSVCLGSTLSLSALGVGGGVWSSSNPAAAAIGSSSGIVSGNALSTSVVITYVESGCSASLNFSVNPLPPPIVGPSTLCVGVSSFYTDPSPGGTWFSASPAVATIGVSSGLLNALSSGASVISYKYLATGCAATKIVTVNTGVSPITGTPSVCLGATTTLSNAISGGSWSSSNISVASVGISSGLVTGIGVGTATITYSIGSGCSTTMVVTVNPLPLSISGGLFVCTGAITTLSDASPGGTWTSGIPAVATVTPATGVVSGVAAGTSLIDYTVTATGCYKSVVVTVNPQPALIGGPSTVCPGSTISLTETTTGGTWSSSPGSIAAIGSSGTVLGVAPGIATISYTSSPGCLRTKSITVNPLPSLIAGPGNVCVGSVITLTDAGGGVWNTAGANASVGSTSGIVTGLTAGPATITYTISNGCYVTSVVTVDPLPAAIGGPSALCVGATIGLSGTGGGTWISATPSVATIGTSSGLVTGFLTGTTVISYTLPTSCATGRTVTVSSSPLPIAGATSVCVGATTLLTDTIAGGLWTSSNPAVADVGSLSGIVTGITAGLPVTITYSLGSGCTVTRGLTVLASPAPVTGTLSLCVGGTSVLASLTPGGSWSSLAPALGSVSTAGLVTGIAPGTATINYAVGGCSSSATVTVNPLPAAITGPSSVCAGSTISLFNSTPGGIWSTSSALVMVGSASGAVTGIAGGSSVITYTAGSCYTTRSVLVNTVGAISGATGLCAGTNTTLTATGGGVWTSSTLGVATVGMSTGVVHGVATGTATITYTLGTGCYATQMVTVSAGPVPIAGSLNVCMGASTSLTDAVGGGTWTISPAAVALIGSLSGVVSGIAVGTASVTYSLGTGCSVTTSVTVHALPSPILGASQVCAGATILQTDATPSGVWYGSTPSIATISSSGLVMGIATGVVNISYAAAGCTITKSITINAIPSAISGSSPVCSGSPAAFTNLVAGGVWSSSNIAVAPIDTVTGAFIAGTPGTAVIGYTLTGGCSITTMLSVTSGLAPVVGPASVCVGHTALFTDASAGGTWSGSNAAVATIGSATGLLTAITSGTVTVSYSFGGCIVTRLISVNAPPMAISGSPTICLLAPAHFTDATSGGIWTSTNASVATVDSLSGVVSGHALGPVIINYATGPGCVAAITVTIIPSPAPISGSSNVCMGNFVSLSDPSPGGVWSSSNPVVATISTTGVAHGLAGGVDTIFYTMPLTGCRSVLPLTVIDLPAITAPGNVCAWGTDSVLVHNSYPGGIFTSALVTVTNLGGGNGVVRGSVPGVGSVTYMVPAGCSVSRSVTVNPLPALISGSLNSCVGQSTTLSDATPAGTWTTGASSVATIGLTSGVLTGVGSGSTGVTYTLPTGCRVDTVVHVSPPPSPIVGPSNACIAATTLYTDSVSGGTWSSSSTSIATVGPLTGIVTGTAAGVVTISYSISSVCSVKKVITVNPLPSVFALSGGGGYCASWPGLHVNLSGSQLGVNYQLYSGITPVDTTHSGTGSALDFGLITTAGSYSVIATDVSTTCPVVMSGAASIVVLPLPVPFTLTGGGNYCAGTSGVHIGLGGSEPGVDYQLYLGAAVSGVALSGSGSSLDFGLRSLPGVYTVTATDAASSCRRHFADSVYVAIVPTVISSVALSASPNDTICAGTTAIYTPVPVNGGLAPAYQWKVNGVNTGTGGSFSYVPANGDLVSVAMASAITCPASPMVTDSLIMTVLTSFVPTVTVTAVPGSLIVSGEPVTFTAVASGAGAAPLYQWAINAIDQSGATSSTYVTSTLNDGDIVACKVTASEPCGGVAGSDHITISVHGNVGIKDIHTPARWSVSPNPNSGSFVLKGITYSVTDRKVALKITDVLGKVVYKSDLQSRHGLIDESILLADEVVSGVYLLTVQTSNDNFVFRLVVEK